ncbi:ribonuclease J [Geothermobacter ehrlichii]|uniref:Ribonuclease J n=1 Tax=Geothermobacter ehrlichii TaxID=213224 RepID=A0A5D3WHG6_9BACT|nr:ribonuclease J [Geothermobacter ehrlichii]TYO97509.1 ribonuclease J [Geothermobacter ehrlichii]
MTPSPNPTDDFRTLRLLPLGGLGEIGLNMLAVECGGKILIIDCGLMFPEPYMLGIDLVIPDVSALRQRRDDILGILLTHGHEDHIGALPYLLDDLGSPPVYGTPLTLGLLKNRLSERRLDSPARLHTVQLRQPLKLGPFEAEFFRVTHSIVDGAGILLRTPAGNILHTGDFKLDPTPVDGQPTDLGFLAACGSEGIDLLLADSTNVENEGHTLSEKSVGDTLNSLIPACRGKVVVSTFSSNIHRIQQILNAAANAGRRVLVNGRSMIANIAVARELGCLRVADDLFIDLRQYETLSPHRVLLLTTGSQGEPLSALSRMAAGDHKQLEIAPGDTVILSSKFIPGNEKAITSLINQLFRRGADVHYETTSEIHVSGHASKEELKTLHALVRPRHFVPIHGEYRHLVRHARLATEMGLPAANAFVLSNGQTLVLGPDGAHRGEEIETGRIFVDGRGVGDLGSVELRDRRHLANHGVVNVILAINQKTGEILYGPEIFSRGFITEDCGGDYLARAEQEVRELLDQHSLETVGDWEEIRVEVRKCLRRFFNRTLDRRPLILPFILEL